MRCMPLPMAYFATLFNVQSAVIAERIKELQGGIERIGHANREPRKIKNPCYSTQRVYEDRRIRLVQIQQEIKVLLKSQ
jgi:hypothetical protein